MNPEKETVSAPLNKKMTVCKHCGAEIAKAAKVCPKCGGKNKKPIYLRWWFIALVVFFLLGVIGGSGGSRKSQTAGTGAQKAAAAPKPAATAKPTPTPIEYVDYDVSELMDDLEANALKAADKYEKQYVRITGKLSTIDSSGKYISLVRNDSKYDFKGVMCYIKSDEQKAQVMEMSAGDQVTLCGKITEVGEVLGYYLNIDYIE